MPWASRITLALLVTVVLFGRSDPALAYEPRVDDSFFGINAPLLVPMAWHDPAAAETHLKAISQTEVDWVRADISWPGAEPVAPVGTVHVYAWRFFDNFFRQAAEERLAVAPIIGGTPLWAQSNLNCGVRSGPLQSRANDYGAFVQAAVERYGPQGHFWKENPDLPYRPVERIELGNEPNWGGYWCPTPEPHIYGRYALAGARGAHAAAPTVQVATGGLVTLRTDELRSGVVHGMATDQFLSQMMEAAPELAEELDSVALHLYDQDPYVNLSLLGWVRDRMREAGLTDQSLYVSEFGWATKGGVNYVSEETRQAAFEALVGQLVRTDCAIDGIAPFTWHSAESNAGNPEHWFGLAGSDGIPYPSGKAYLDKVALFEGKGPQPPPRQTVHVCNAPAPDSDNDGVADEEDDYPIDPNRSTGSGEVPPPDPDAPVGPAQAPRLPSDFFGVYARTMPWQAQLRGSYLDSMQSMHIGTLRDTTHWDHAQPAQPASADESPIWTETDPRVLGAARRGMRVQPTMIDRPSWVSTTPAQADAEFGAFISAYAARYGREGSFWAENGNLDKALAVRDYEIWSDVELNRGAWDGSASPGEYAATYLTARRALQLVDPAARAVMPLHEASQLGTAGDFIRAAVGSAPDLRGSIDSVYVEILQAASAQEVETIVASVRAALDATGNSQASIKTGIGWNTGGPGAISEAQRTSLFENVTDRLARSDCGVETVIADSWTMAESDPQNSWDWLGIADPVTGDPRPSGQAFGAVASGYLGFGESSGRAIVHSCNAADPDRDSDGVPDPADDFPLDASRVDGTPPSVTIKGPGRRTSPALFRLSASDAIGVSRLECRTDDAAWTACQDSYRTKRLTRGRHAFEARAFDAEGNIGRNLVRWKVRRR